MLLLHQLSGELGFTNRAHIDTIYKIMVGMRVLAGNQVFTGTDNVSGERVKHRLKRCVLSPARTVSEILQAQVSRGGYR